MMVKRKILLAFSFLFISLIGLLAQDIPDRPVPPRLVNDFTGILSAQEVNALENKLVAYNDSTSTQIAIVIVPDLNGYDKADYAQRLGQKWGVGQKGNNNGIVILVKPKTSGSNGQVYIATGYGIEGPAPDLKQAEIIDNQILPAFRNGDYYGGLDKAVDSLIAVLRGEYQGSGQKQNSEEKNFPFAIFIIVFIIIALFSKRGGGRNRRITSGSDLPLWILMGMLGSGGRSHRGSWGGFSGGHSGGGFGGFGGGSFGGGGAGGSW
ncbi:MAG TPA: TPM domain-containing protein [Bacteroidales bacterium]|nr:TPM domain-containing protein [Bacteroidales bacterium]